MNIVIKTLYNLSSGIANSFQVTPLFSRWIYSLFYTLFDCKIPICFLKIDVTVFQTIINFFYILILFHFSKQAYFVLCESEH